MGAYSSAFSTAFDTIALIEPVDLTTIDPVEAVQRGLWELLRSDAVIMSLVKEVLDAEPEQSAREYPYMSIPDLESVVDGTHDDPGRMITARIYTYVKGDVRSRNERVDNRAGARLVYLLDHGHKLLDQYVQDHKVWMVHHVSSRTINDDRRSARRRVDQVNIWTTNLG